MNRTELSRTDRCLTCGYELAGLTDDANCPECDYPLRWTREGDWLGRASHAQIRRQMGLLRIMACAVLVYGAVHLMLIAASRLMLLMHWQASVKEMRPPAFFDHCLYILWTISAVSVIVWALCSAALVRADVQAPASRHRLRKWLCVLLSSAWGLTVVPHLASLLWLQFNPSLWYTWNWNLLPYRLTYILSVAEMALSFAQPAVLIAYIAGLGSRMRDSRLRKIAWWTAVLVPMILIGRLVYLTSSLEQWYTLKSHALTTALFVLALGLVARVVIITALRLAMLLKEVNPPAIR